MSTDRCLVDCYVFLLVVSEYSQKIIIHICIRSTESMTLEKLMLRLNTSVENDGYPLMLVF